VTGRGSALTRAAIPGPVILTDFSVRPFDADSVRNVAGALAGSCDALLVGEHQDSPDFPPALMASMIIEAGGSPWITLTCRDRNRLVLEQELAGLRHAGADGVLCVTGDGRAPGVRPGVTQVFDLDGTRLAAMAASAGLCTAVPESPAAPPVEFRPRRLLEKQRAGAELCVLNHVGRPADAGAFAARAREAGVTLPLVAAVAVYTDEPSAAVLQHFPGLQLDPRTVNSVLSAPDPVAAGIAAAVTEAGELLAIDGISGVNISGMASERGHLYAAEIKAAVGRAIRAGAG
jgi:methylenetetrahydrofolate reductase (NADPH)